MTFCLEARISEEVRVAYAIRSFVIGKWFVFFFFFTYQYLKRYLTHDRLGTCRVFAIEKLSNIYIDMYEAFSRYQLFLYLVDTVFFKTTIIINCNVVNVK